MGVSGIRSKKGRKTNPLSKYTRKLTLRPSTDDHLRVRDHLFSLTRQLATKNITSMFTTQDARGSSKLETREIPSRRQVLPLEMLPRDDQTRTIRIVKSRGSGHDGRRHPLSIQSGRLPVR